MPELLDTCPFCGAKPKHGLGKIQYDQLHGDPCQRYRVWCPMGSGVSFDGSHARIDGCDQQVAFGLWNQRPSLARLSQPPVTPDSPDSGPEKP